MKWQIFGEKNIMQQFSVIICMKTQKKKKMMAGSIEATQIRVESMLNEIFMKCMDEI